MFCLQRLLRSNRSLLLNRSLEVSSQIRYESAFYNFTKFCLATSSVNERVDEELLVQYVVWRFTYSKVIANTVSTEISGIISHLKRNCRSCEHLNREKMYTLKCLMRGYRKLRPSKNSKAALTDDLLRKLMVGLEPDNFNDAVLKAALIFKKGLVLRNSEGWKWEHEKRGLLVKHVQFLKKNEKIVGLVVRFNHSKANQYGKSEFAVAPCVCRHGKLCAVHAMWDLIEMKSKCGLKMGPNAPLFTKKNGKLLSMSDIGKELKRLCKSAGVDPGLFGPHSLRKGGATDYIAWGIPVEIVKEMGRWAVIESMDPYRQLDAVSTLKLTMTRIDEMFAKLKL